MREEPRRVGVETVPPAQMPEVLRLAAELHAREQARIAEVDQNRHLVQAAVEVGLPVEYLERAAAIVTEQRAEQAATRLPRKAQCGRSRPWMAMSVAVGMAVAVLSHHGSGRERFSAPPPWSPMIAASAPIPASASMSLIGPCTEIDLSRYVTQRLDGPMLQSGNDLSMLLAGLREGGLSHRILRGVPFRLDGVVLVGPSPSLAGDGVVTTVAPQVEGIAIDRKAKRIHFLHGTHWRARDGMEIGAYIVHYADGTRLEVPIRYGEDVRDWWVRSDPNPRVTRARLAWRGSNEAADRNRSRIRLYMSSWENPYPGRTIRSLDMVTGLQAAGPEAPAPFLVGLTVEQKSDTRAPVTPGKAHGSFESP